MRARNAKERVEELLKIIEKQFTLLAPYHHKHWVMTPEEKRMRSYHEKQIKDATEALNQIAEML